MTASLSGPATVTIASGANQSSLFSLDLTVGDQDTYVENRNCNLNYVVQGSARALNYIIDSENGRRTPDGDLEPQSFEFANVTVPSESDASITYSFNYHAVKLQDTAYPLERVFKFQVYDNAPAGPLPDNPYGYKVHDTNNPVVSRNITVERGQ